MFYFRGVFSCCAHQARTEKQRRIPAKITDFSTDEDGIATVWAMFWLIICFALSGLAVDVTNAWKVQQFLQSTADASALAGAYELGRSDNANIEAAVEKQANMYASANLGDTGYGDVLIDEDIQVGYWVPATKTFTEMTAADTDIPNAVRAITRQNRTQNHGVSTFFLRFAGFTEFTIATSATAKMFVAKCDFDGLIANGHVKLATKQAFLDEFCVHGELGIDLSQDNYFESGTIASMDNLDDCGPSAGHCENAANLGIEEAKREWSLGDGGKPANIDEYISGLLSGGGKYVPDYVTAGSVKLITVTNKDPFDIADLDANRVNKIVCPVNGGGYDLNLKSDVAMELSKLVIVGDSCDFVFDPSVKIVDAIIATTATGTQTFRGPTKGAGIVLGKDDNEYDPDFGELTKCKDGGEVTLITKGSVNFSAKLSAYDLEIIARDDVHLAAKANNPAVHIGTNVSAGGDIMVTTGHTFHGCEGRTSSVFDPQFSYALVM